jgi:hypothetical protein
MSFSVKDVPKTLCGSCAHSTIIGSPQRTGPTIVCRFLDRVINYAVSSCNSYEDRGKPSPQTYERIAWIVDTKGGKFIGFLKPGSKRHNELTRGEL